MGLFSKGSTPTSTETTVNQSSLPDYVRPQFEGLLDRAESLADTPYQAYGGQRIAPLGGDIAASHDLTRQIAGSGIAGLPEAMGAVTNSMGAGQDIFNNQSPYQYGQTQLFTDPGRMGEYMSPYIRNVLDEQKRQANEQFNIQRADRSSRAVQAGAFGGSRHGVQESLAEDDLLNRMANIEATGMQNAFQNAQQAFQADRSAMFGREQAQAAEDMASTNMGLQALGFANQSAGQLSGLGEIGRATDIQNAQMLEAIGDTQRVEQQRMLDLGYEDFLRQQAYPEQQLQFYSSILRGVPVEPTVTQTMYQPTNPGQTALGLGLGAIGLYRGLTA
jgi:hypothetical protein